MIDTLLDQIAKIRDEYANKRRDALDQLEFSAGQGDAKEASLFSTEAERHGAALMACNRVLKLATEASSSVTSNKRGGAE